MSAVFTTSSPLRTTRALSPLVLPPARGLAAPPLAVGQPFPDLVLPALDDGRPLSVADFRGKKVVLLVFASW